MDKIKCIFDYKIFFTLIFLDYIGNLMSSSMFSWYLLFLREHRCLNMLITLIFQWSIENSWSFSKSFKYRFALLILKHVHFENHGNLTIRPWLLSKCWFSCWGSGNFICIIYLLELSREKIYILIFGQHSRCIAKVLNWLWISSYLTNLIQIKLFLNSVE